MRVWNNILKVENQSLKHPNGVLNRKKFVHTFELFHPSLTNCSSRLVVTKAVQCDAWNQWCTAHKKSRNARISHSENPAKSDAVKFFLHLLSTEPHSHFNFKPTLYSHFQRLLGTPKKVLLLTEANFASKVNPSRKYPACDIDTVNLFDEDVDRIFNLEEPNSPVPVQLHHWIRPKRVPNLTLVWEESSALLLLRENGLENKLQFLKKFPLLYSCTTTHCRSIPNSTAWRSISRTTSNSPDN